MHPRPAGLVLSRRRKDTLPTIFVFLLLSVFAGTPAHAEAFPSLRLHREVRYVMGTLLDITLYHHDARQARESLNKAFSLAQKLDGLLSNYKPRSEVSRLNRKGGQGRVPVSTEFYELLLEAKQLSLKTEGVFDITVGALLDLWEAAVRRDALPASQSLEKALKFVGMNQVLFHPGRQVELLQSGVRIDTGGIGKGYAVDLIARLFRESGIEAGLINFGQSSVYAIGSPPQSPTWELLLQFQDQDPLGIVQLKDQAFSASDSLGRSFEVAGQKYGHLIDPRSGNPMTERVQAVVIAPSATDAEALTKYVILQGCNKKGMLGKSTQVQAIRISPAGRTLCSGEPPILSLHTMGQ